MVVQEKLLFPIVLRLHRLTEQVVLRARLYRSPPRVELREADAAIAVRIEPGKDGLRFSVAQRKAQATA